MTTTAPARLRQPGRSSLTTSARGLFVDLYRPEHPQHDEVLLFVHGAGCGSWYWENAATQLAAAGWQCAALNWRGHHRSRPIEESELGACTVYDYVEDIDEVVTELELSAFITVAHSIGCLVALKHAEVGFGQPRGLALYSPAPTQAVKGYDFPSFGPGRCVPAFDRNAARYWFFYDISDEDLDRYTGLLGPESSTLLDASGRTTIDVSPARVSGPVLVVSASCDVIQGPNAGLDHAMAREFGAEYRVVRNHGHLLLVENRWEDGVGPLLGWLGCHFPASVDR